MKNFKILAIITLSCLTYYGCKENTPTENNNLNEKNVKYIRVPTVSVTSLTIQESLNKDINLFFNKEADDPNKNPYIIECLNGWKEYRFSVNIKDKPSKAYYHHNSIVTYGNKIKIIAFSMIWESLYINSLQDEYDKLMRVNRWFMAEASENWHRFCTLNTTGYVRLYCDGYYVAEISSNPFILGTTRAIEAVNDYPHPDDNDLLNTLNRLDTPPEEMSLPANNKFPSRIIIYDSDDTLLNFLAHLRKLKTATRDELKGYDPNSTDLCGIDIFKEYR